jgi:hypothetical protein
VLKANVRKEAEDEQTVKKNKINSLCIQNENNDMIVDNENDDQLLTVSLYIYIYIYR